MDGRFEYGNARVKAIKSRLFSRHDYATWVLMPELRDLIAALRNTGYKVEVEHALLRYPTRLTISGAVRSHLLHVISSLRTFYRDHALNQVLLYLLRLDVFNLKTIIRGLARKASSDEILAHIIPAGELDDAACAELARQPDVRSALNLLRTWSLPYAHELLESWPRYNQSGLLSVLEIALERYRYKRLFEDHTEENGPSILRQAVASEFDIANILICMILISEKCDLSDEESGNLFVRTEGLQISIDRIRKLLHSKNMETIVSELQDTAYYPSLKKALLEYSATGDLTVFQRAMEYFLMMEGERLYKKDPLGVGVVIGLVRALEVEAANLRFIADAKTAGIQTQQIWNQLLIPFERTMS